MPIEPPAGYLTRPEASRLYNRSQRALERDLDTALGVGDRDILIHFKLVTKDGEMRDAHEVTVDQVKELVSAGMTPVWYVEETWLLETYGRKGEPRLRPSRESQAGFEGEDVSGRTSFESTSDPIAAMGIDMTALYREQLRKRDDEIKFLRREIDIKNEQIREANTRTRESNLLMQDLQKMLGSWQQRAFESLPASREPLSDSKTMHSVIEPEARTNSQPVTRSSPQRAASAKKTTNSVKKKQPPKKTHWLLRKIF